MSLRILVQTGPYALSGADAVLLRVVPQVVQDEQSIPIDADGPRRDYRAQNFVSLALKADTLL